MKIKNISQPIYIVTAYLFIIISLAFSQNNPFLLIAGLLTGILFILALLMKKNNPVDEREKLVRDKAAQITYMIFAPTIAIGACLLIIFGKLISYYLESLGLVLAYLSLFIIALYAISYVFINQEYGGNDYEE